MNSATMAERKHEHSSLSKQLVIGFLVESVASFWVRCTKQATRASRQCKRQATRASKHLAIQCTKQATRASRRLLSFPTTISNKAIQFRHKKRISEEPEEGGGIWQRSIIMGDKCQPLDFPGVIYYDSDGNRLPELPMKSPCASPGFTQLLCIDNQPYNSP